MVIFLKSKNTAPFRVLSWPSSLKHPTYVPRGREHSRDSEVPDRGTDPNQGPTPWQRQGNPQPFLAKGTSQRSPGDEAAGQPFQSLPRHLHLVLSLSLFLVKAHCTPRQAARSLVLVWIPLSSTDPNSASLAGLMTSPGPSSSPSS